MSDIIFKLPEIYESAVTTYKSLIEKKQPAVFEEVERPADKNKAENILVQGDNLRYMSYLINNGFEGKLDMIYVDPPFFSKSDYTINIKVGSGNKKIELAKNLAFTDRWSEGMEEYLKEMTVRLLMMRRLLSDTGSLFVHLDWHSSHYMKIILDQIFGEENFINEIVWNYKSGGAGKRFFARKHDVILFYAKSSRYYFEVQKEKSYNRGLKPYRFKGVKEYKDEVGWYTMVSMKDVWQLDMVGRTSSERTGYATQKPVRLIERIIQSAAPENGLCADFFCGSGSLGAACINTGRRFLLCDNSAPAVMIAHKRLLKEGSEHSLLAEKKENTDSNFSAKISLTKADGVIAVTGISIDGINYQDYNALGITEENLGLMETVVRNHYDQLIEYWCVDPSYDGKTLRPSMFICKEKDDIDLALTLPDKQITKLAVKVLDIFGNEYAEVF